MDVLVLNSTAFKTYFQSSNIFKKDFEISTSQYNKVLRFSTGV